MPRVLSTRDLLAADTMQELVAEVERISLLHPVDHDRYDRRDNKPKPKSGAASAAPDGGKGKPSCDSIGGSSHLYYQNTKQWRR